MLHQVRECICQSNLKNNNDDKNNISRTINSTIRASRIAGGNKSYTLHLFIHVCLFHYNLEIVVSNIPLTSPTFLKAHDEKVKLSLIQFNNLIYLCIIAL